MQKVSVNFKSIAILGLTLALLSLFTCDAFGSQRVYVNDILSNPSRYFNTVVEIEGYVISTSPGNIMPSGTYILADDLGGQIEVQTRDLPAAGKRFIVKGAVAQDPSSSIPYLREMSRGSGYKLILLAAAVVVFIALVVVFLVIAFRSGRAPVVVEKPTLEETTVYKGEPASTVRYLDVDATLTVIAGPELHKVYPVVGKEHIIGRGGDIKMADADPTISRSQARLTYEGNGNFTLTQLSDRNPTRVNGESLTHSRALKSGDEIQVGRETKLRFEVRPL